MFGTLGFSELIIIVVIILIIFGAGRLPQIGEGIGKALKGFKKEVHEAPPADTPIETAGTPDAHAPSPNQSSVTTQPAAAQPAPTAEPAERPASVPYVPGPEMTPGTTASVLVSGLAPQTYVPPKPKTSHPGQSQQPAAATAAAPATAPPIPTMEERMTQPPPQSRGTYPPVPPVARPTPPPKRPSAVVNKDAVARVQAQQAALRAQSASKAAPSGQDMQGLGETLGDALRIFRQAAADVRNSVDPEMRTIRAEMEAAQKELEQSIEAAKQIPTVQEEPPKQS
jgi:TatA/E family protein of Tat protein translocase